jgi:hypothetical protein
VCQTVHTPSGDASKQGLCPHMKNPRLKRGEIRKQAKSLKSSRLWTAGKQVTTE